MPTKQILDEEPEVQGASGSATPNEDAWFEAMGKKYPEQAGDREALFQKSQEGYDAEHDYAKKSRAENEAMAEIIGESPELAELYAEMYTRGKDGNPEMALRLLPDALKKYINGGSEEDYIADKASAADRQKKLEVQDQIFNAWCEKKGYDPAEWSQKIAEKLFEPMKQFELTEAQFDLLDQMLNYDNDVDAARIQGRNEIIVANRRKMTPASDGLAHAASAPSGYAEQPKKKASPLDDVVSRRQSKRNL